MEMFSTQTRGWGMHGAFHVAKLKSEAYLGLEQDFHPNGCTASDCILSLIAGLLAPPVQRYCSQDIVL